MTEAAWIRNSIFSSEDDLKNIHTFYRKKLELDSKPTAAKLTFTADDYCKIYINGRFAVSGPAPGYPRHYYYSSVDVSEFLTAGENIIAVHGYYQGLVNRVWNSGDGLAGLKLALAVDQESGNSAEIVTDDSWRCFDCIAYKSERMFGYETQFAEDIDMRRIPSNWTTSAFDDSFWKQAEKVKNYPHNLIPQPTEPLAWKNIFPKSVTQLDNGHWLIDFGREVVGCTVIKAQGAEGQLLEIRHAEELNEDGSARYKMRAACEYKEFITLSGKADRVEYFDYKAFRYVELVNFPGIPEPEDIFVIERHYPTDHSSELKTSDNILDRIWDICALAVKLGTQDSYLDCMSREKGAYLGDAYVTGLSHLYLTGRHEMLKKVLEDFAISGETCPGLNAVAPGAFEQEIAEYSLLWIPLLYEYYMWTGNVEFVSKMIPTVNNVLSYFVKYENSDGLLADFKGKPVMVDWPENLRDGYDDPGLMGANQDKQSGINTLLNIHYYGTISYAAQIYAAADMQMEAAGITQKAESLKSTIKNKFLTDKGFVDTDSSDHVSLHPNALALMFNMLSADEAKSIISIIREKRIRCGVYFSFFVLKGLFNYGEYELAYDLLTCDDTHSWQTMLKDGATTCMEAWGVDQKWNTSLCHPWASAPIYMIAAEIFGLKPAAPGWTEITNAPKIPSSLSSGSIAINTPRGKVEATFVRGKDGKVETNVQLQGK